MPKRKPGITEVADLNIRGTDAKKPVRRRKKKEEVILSVKPVDVTFRQTTVKTRKHHVEKCIPQLQLFEAVKYTDNEFRRYPEWVQKLVPHWGGAQVQAYIGSRSYTVTKGDYFVRIKKPYPDKVMFVVHKNQFGLLFEDSRYLVEDTKKGLLVLEARRQRLEKKLSNLI